MKIIENKFIPFPGFAAINLFGFVFCRRGLTAREISHEAIHSAQMKELGYVFFYALYIIEWVLRIPFYGILGAYENVSFEREAYAWDDFHDHHVGRRPYFWITYIFLNPWNR